MQQLTQQEIVWNGEKAMYTGAVDGLGRPHGAGRMETKGGVYTGEFVEGREEGQVRRRDTKKKKRQHTTHTFLFCAQGVMEYSNGNRYEGQFKDNKRHGRGVLVWARGERYSGDFVQVRKNGSVISFPRADLRPRMRGPDRACSSGRAATDTRAHSSRISGLERERFFGQMARRFLVSL